VLFIADFVIMTNSTVHFLRKPLCYLVQLFVICKEVRITASHHWCHMVACGHCFWRSVEIETFWYYTGRIVLQKERKTKKTHKARKSDRV